MLYRKLPRISRAYSRLLTTEPVGLSRVPHTETLHLNTNQFCPSIKLLRTTAMAPVGEVKESGSPISKAPRLEKQCEGETYPEVTEELPPNSTNVILRFAKLTENALTPTRGSKLAAGYDLYSAYDYVIPAKGKVLAKTDIQIALPDGCYGRVAPRSGLAHKHYIDVGAGVIDQDYRGNVGVIMFNFGEDEFKVNKGDRVAQLILERIFLPDLEELPTLDATERGEGGFGSTGKN